MKCLQIHSIANVIVHPTVGYANIVGKSENPEHKNYLQSLTKGANHYKLRLKWSGNKINVLVLATANPVSKEIFCILLTIENFRWEWLGMRV